MNITDKTTLPLSFVPRPELTPSKSRNRWQYPELVKIKLTPDAMIISTCGKEIPKESTVTLFTGNLLLSKDVISDPVLRDLVNTAKKTLNEMQKFLSTNFLSRNFILKNENSVEIMKELYELQKKLSDMDREIPSQFQSVEEIFIAAEKIRRVGIGNCKHLSILAFADLYKSCHVRLQIIEGGDHMNLVLTSLDGSKSILFDPWSKMIAPADARPVFVPIGVTIVKNPKPFETFLSSPILVPVNPKQTAKTIFSSPIRARL